MEKLNDLKKRYEFACNEYVERFCNKQELYFDGWLGGIVGGIAFCNDFYFNLHDIAWDLNSNQPKGAIIDWCRSNLEDAEKSIDYYSYTKGIRVSDLFNQKLHMEDNRVNWLKWWKKISKSKKRVLIEKYFVSTDTDNISSREIEIIYNEVYGRSER